MKGFTLIELLVVVVIIGILASIALPQYELVVEKARASEAMVNAKAIQDACQRHMQEYPEDNCGNRSKIADVQLKGGSWNSKGNKFTTKNFSYLLNDPTEDAGIPANTFEVERLNGIYYIYFYEAPEGTTRVKETTCPDDYAQVCRLFDNN